MAATRGPVMVVMVVVVVVLTFLGLAHGHGRLMDPPARNAMWRLGYPNPVNYNDNELYCGGFAVLYEVNQGQCGVCGDDYREREPRSHEAGGYYGNGIVAKRYVVGQVIEVEAELTTNHWGYMEVRLCPHNDRHLEITQACLDTHVLPLASTGETRFTIPEDTPKTATFKWRVKLPDGVTCSHCVMQWKYFTGNTWGMDESGGGSIGYGPQETFINCADVSIFSNTFVPPAAVDNPWQLYFRGSFPGQQWETNPNPKSGSNELTPLVVRAQLCIPVGHFKRQPQMHDWCMENCLKYPPNCDAKYCSCVYECEAIGTFREQAFADHFCHQECLGYPSDCPWDLCTCF